MRKVNLFLLPFDLKAEFVWKTIEQYLSIQ